MSDRIKLIEVPVPGGGPVELAEAAGGRGGAAGHAYDQVPYRSYPYRQTRPERLATVATLLGMTPPAVEGCRVLELGCCSGGNLIPMAEQLPGARFVGVDASARQIALGAAAVEKLGMGNIRLVHGDILEIGPHWGKFDYIICHGVYSWVPAPVREKILSLCAENLSYHGVAYVSYNTYPGWRMRGVIRDIMRYRARALARPADRLFHARALVDFLAQSASVENNPYGMLLKQELELLRGKEDSYLLHEHLEEVNEPVYFHEFAARAGAAGLQYLGEADFGAMSLQNLPQKFEAVLTGVASDVIELEQYMDFVRNRMFRQTLLCHAGHTIRREVEAERVVGLFVSSPARPEATEVDVESGAKAVFRGGGAVTTTSDPLVKAALVHLGQVWPLAVPFAELLARARARLNRERAIVDASHLNRDARRLAETMLRCYATSQVELSVRGSAFTTAAPERPAAPAYARLQAQDAAAVTNLRHESIRLGDLERHVVRHLDGTRDRAALLDVLAALARRGELLVHESGQTLDEEARIRQALGEPLSRALSELAGRCLLVMPAPASPSAGRGPF